MDSADFLGHLSVEGRALVSAARGNLEAPVAACPGWSVTDLVTHTGQVFARIASIVRSGELERPPGGWPMVEPSSDLLGWHEQQLADVVAVLGSRRAEQPAWSWYPPEQTIGFWCRRMAQEALVHRVDAEMARGLLSPVDRELSLDGIDEVLVRFLLADANEEPEPAWGQGESIRLRASGHWWSVTLQDRGVRVEAGVDGVAPADNEVGSAAVATVAGNPDQLLLWLWGRAGNDVITTSGEGELIVLRTALARVTQ